MIHRPAARADKPLGLRRIHGQLAGLVSHAVDLAYRRPREHHQRRRGRSPALRRDARIDHEVEAPRHPPAELRACEETRTLNVVAPMGRRRRALEDVREPLYLVTLSASGRGTFVEREVEARELPAT